MTDASRPWVLLRKGMSRVTAETLEKAKFPHDFMRRGYRQPDAVIFGPHGEAWYCGGKLSSQWERDDDRRTREAAAARAAGKVPQEEDVSA